MKLLVVILCSAVMCSSIPVSEEKNRVKRSDNSDEMNQNYMQPQFQQFPIPIPVPFPQPFAYPFVFPPVPRPVLPPVPPVIPPIGK